MDNIHQLLVDVWSNDIIPSVDFSMLYVNKYFHMMAKKSIIATKLTTLRPLTMNAPVEGDFQHLIHHLCGAIICEDNLSIAKITRQIGGICRLEALYISSYICNRLSYRERLFSKRTLLSLSKMYNKLCKYVTVTYKWSEVYSILGIPSTLWFVRTLIRMPDLEAIGSDSRIMIELDKRYSFGDINKGIVDLMRKIPIPNDVAFRIVTKNVRRSAYTGFFANRISDKYLNRHKDNILAGDYNRNYTSCVIHEFVLRNPTFNYLPVMRNRSFMVPMIIEALSSKGHVPDLSLMIAELKKAKVGQIKDVLNIYISSHFDMVKDKFKQLIQYPKFMTVLLRNVRTKHLFNDLNTREIVSVIASVRKAKYSLHAIRSILEHKEADLPKNFLDHIAILARDKLEDIMKILPSFKLSKAIVDVIVLDIDESRIC